MLLTLGVRSASRWMMALADISLYEAIWFWHRRPLDAAQPEQVVRPLAGLMMWKAVAGSHSGRAGDGAKEEPIEEDMLMTVDCDGMEFSQSRTADLYTLPPSYVITAHNHPRQPLGIQASHGCVPSLFHFPLPGVDSFSTLLIGWMSRGSHVQSAIAVAGFCDPVDYTRSQACEWLSIECRGVGYSFTVLFSSPASS